MARRKKSLNEAYNQAQRLMEFATSRNRKNRIRAAVSAMNDRVQESYFSRRPSAIKAGESLRRRTEKPMSDYERYGRAAKANAAG